MGASRSCVSGWDWPGGGGLAPGGKRDYGTGMQLAAKLPSLSHPLAQALVLFAIAAVVHLAPADLPLSGDEAMYAAVAKEVARSGELFELRLNGAPYLNKPPLFFDALALAFNLFGVSDRTAQVAAGSFTVASVLALFVACRMMFGAWEIGFLAGLVFLMTPEAVHWGRGVRLEGMLAVLCIASVAAAFQSVQWPAAGAVTFLGCGLGFLTKGPQGLFPLALLPILWWRAGLLRARIGCRWTVFGASGLVVVVAPWLAWRWHGHGFSFVEAYLQDQVLSTIVGEAWPGRGPAWYAAKLARTYWPWAPFALAGAIAAWRSSPGAVAVPETASAQGLGRRRAAAEAWGWYALLVFCIISVSALKKGRYLFPLYLPFSVFSALALERIGRKVAGFRVFLALAALVVATALAVVGDRPSAEAQANVAEALAVASGLGEGERVLLTASVAWGRHGFGKILGFYARGRLLACRGDCADELGRLAGRGSVVMRRGEELKLAGVGEASEVVLLTRRLAVVSFGPSGTAPRSSEGSTRGRGQCEQAPEASAVAGPSRC